MSGIFRHSSTQGSAIQHPAALSSPLNGSSIAIRRIKSILTSAPVAAMTANLPGAGKFSLMGFPFKSN
jgi:hypothetical protein